MAYLEHQQTKERWQIEMGITRIGRSTSAQIQLRDDTVSQSHCMIRMTEEGCLLLDLNSSNGTFVNHQRIGQQWLNPGDKIELGKMALVFVSKRSTDSSAMMDSFPIPPVPPPPVYIQPGPMTPQPPPLVPPGIPPSFQGASWPAPPPFYIEKPKNPSRMKKVLITLSIIVVAFLGIGFLFIIKWGPFTQGTFAPASDIEKQHQNKRPAGDSTASRAPVPQSRLLAQGVVNVDGGKVEVPQQIVLTFPAGVVDREEEVTIRSAGSDETGRFFKIETSGGEGLFNRPVTVDFPIPAGRKADEFTPVQQLTGGTWQVLPANTNRGSVLSTEVMHFSGVGILDHGRTWTQGVSTAVGAGTAGAILIIVAGAATAELTGPMALLVLVCGAGGWFSGGAVYDHVLMEGKIGPMPIQGFDLFMDEEDLPPGPRLRVWINKRNGQLLAMTDPQEAIKERDRAPTIGPPGRELGTTITFSDGTVVASKDVSTFLVPLSVLYLGRQLQQNRRWFSEQGYKVPERIPVIITPRVGNATSGIANERNAGEWLPDAGVLLVNSKDMPTWEETEQFTNSQTLRVGSIEVTFLEPRPGNLLLSENVRSTLAHEYVHALWPENGFEEVFEGAEESTAVSFESQLCPDSTDFLRLYPWYSVAPVLRSGLLWTGSDEDRFKRGYQLWPWTKFLMHTQGHVEFRRYLNDDLSQEDVQSLFRNFCHQILVEENGLSDPALVPVVSGTQAQSSTGWKDIDLMVMSKFCRLDKIEMGRVDLPLTRPFSLTVLRARLPGAPTGQGLNPVIVRRYAPSMIEEIAVLKPVQNTSGKFDRAPTLDDISFNMLANMAPAEWFKDDQTAFLPIAIIGCEPVIAYLNQQPLGPEEPNPLLVYRLVSPEVQSIMPMPAVTEDTRQYGIQFNLPSLGPNIALTDVMAGYRLMGKTAGGKEGLIGEYLLSRDQAIHQFSWWYKGVTGGRTIQPDSTSLSVPEKDLEPYTQCALVSMDARLKEKGQPLCSKPQWRDWRVRPTGWMLVDTRVENHFNQEPYSQSYQGAYLNETVSLTLNPGGFNFQGNFQRGVTSEWKPKSRLEAELGAQGKTESISAALTWNNPPVLIEEGKKMTFTVHFKKEGETTVFGDHYSVSTNSDMRHYLVIDAPGTKSIEFSPPHPSLKWEVIVAISLKSSTDRGTGRVTYVYEYR